MFWSKKYIVAACVVCIAVCLGEFSFLFILGAHYPGYNQLKDTMSKLGASASPVSNLISAWWIIMGILFIFFGTGIYKAYIQKNKKARLASILIILYGLGEGLGSGLFKANRLPDSWGLPMSTIIHDILGGFGVLGIVILPLVMRKIITKTENPRFYRFSLIVFILTLATLSLFLFRYLPDKNNVFTMYKGLWQRLFMLTIYVYLSGLAVITIRNINKS